MILVTALAGGCGDEHSPTTPHVGTPTIEITVRDRDTEATVAGVKIVLFDDAQHVVGGPSVSDTTGRCRFAWSDPSASMRVLALPGDSLRVIAVPAPFTPDAAHNTATITVAPLGQPAGLPRITGHIVDADTGEPLAAAFVSLSPFLSGFLGWADATDDVTLDDGVFAVSDIPFAIDPVSGNIDQLIPLVITHDGYEPRLWSHHPRPGDLNVDIRDVVIALSPAPSGTGRLIGRVLSGTQPVPDLLVGLGGLGDGDLAAKAAGWPGHVTRTDQEGAFAFAELPPGRYVVQPAFTVGDGWAFPTQPGNVPHAVADSIVVDAGDLQVVPTITAIAPADTTIAAADLVFRWSLPGDVAVDTFAIYLDGQRLARTAATRYAPPRGDIATGWHAWYVHGLSAQNELLASQENASWFAIAP